MRKEHIMDPIKLPEGEEIFEGDFKEFCNGKGDDNDANSRQ